jgi:multidrug efflux pump subunit AcrB
VIKQPGANLITMSTDMDAKLKELQKIIPQYKNNALRTIQFVGDAVKSVTDSLLIGLAIIVAILF